MTGRKSRRTSADSDDNRTDSSSSTGDSLIKFGIVALTLVYIVTKLRPPSDPLPTTLSFDNHESPPVSHPSSHILDDGLGRLPLTPSPRTIQSLEEAMGHAAEPKSGFMAQALHTLSHALDPIEAAGLTTAVRVPLVPLPTALSSVHISYSNAPAPLSPTTVIEESPRASSPWSWENYTRSAHDNWPQCSQSPNCLNFKPDQSCSKWKSIGNYPVLVRPPQFR